MQAKRKATKSKFWTCVVLVQCWRIPHACDDTNSRSSSTYTRTQYCTEYKCICIKATVDTELSVTFISLANCCSDLVPYWFFPFVFLFSFCVPVDVTTVQSTIECTPSVDLKFWSWTGMQCAGKAENDFPVDIFASVGMRKHAILHIMDTFKGDCRSFCCVLVAFVFCG
jgi:hypothetical protein